MKRVIIGLVALVVLMVCVACDFGSGSSDKVDVKGYYKSNGTYVEPHTRSKGGK